MSILLQYILIMLFRAGSASTRYIGMMENGGLIITDSLPNLQIQSSHGCHYQNRMEVSRND